MPTMKDIAMRAGVSQTAVSFVLNKRERTNGSISECTQRRVLAAAAELGYKNNELARAMTRGRSRVVGFITRNPEAEHVARLVAGALHEADERGYFLKILCPRENGFDQRLLDQCIELRLAGAIGSFLYPAPLDPYHHELARYQIPLALLDDSGTYEWGAPVLANYEEGMRQAVDHLTALGHRKIGFVGGPAQQVGTQARLKGFHQALGASGLTVPDEHLAHCEWDQLFETLQLSLSQMESPPTAFITATDAAALALLRAARRLKIEVPRDLSVVSFGDLAMAYLCDPPLTTIHHPFNEMGRVVTRQLLDRVEVALRQVDAVIEPLPGSRVATQLIVRESTGPPRSCQF